MELFRASRSKYKKVYGLPTFRGLALTAILSGALWFSLANDSETERWLFLLMILLSLVHLTDSSQPFRHLQVRILPFDPPFAGEVVRVPVQLSNQTEFKLDFTSIKFRESEDRVEVAPISRHSSALVFLPLRFRDSGEIVMPKITIQTSPTPKLFRYWRVIDFSEKVFVLPKPVDHNVAFKPTSLFDGDVELTDIEQIRDQRLLPLMDQKLYLKTGTPYRRVHKSMGSSEQVSLIWSYLDHLSLQQKGEQFSYWIQFASSEKRNLEISVNTPFMKSSQASRAMSWRDLKNGFAKWFYAQP